jgi:hypothetical protein
MNGYIQMFAFIIAAILPFILIAKWRHWGAIVSVLFGWAFVFLAGQMFPTDARFEELGAGVWLFGGWFIMLAWCLPIYLGFLIYRWYQKRSHD